MANDDGRCPDCNAPISSDETLCGNCGLNLVTGEKFEDKLKRAKGAQKTTDQRNRVGGVALAIGFGVIILAGFMYQRRTMSSFQDNPDQTLEYVAAAQKVQRLVSRSKMVQSMSEREEYREEAKITGENLLEDLESTVQQGDGEENESNGPSGTYKTFVRNLKSKVEYHLSRL